MGLAVCDQSALLLSVKIKAHFWVMLFHGPRILFYHPYYGPLLSFMVYIYTSYVYILTSVLFLLVPVWLRKHIEATCGCKFTSYIV